MPTAVVRQSAACPHESHGLAGFLERDPGAGQCRPITNGLGFSPDGRTLHHSDCRRQTVFRYDMRDSGDLGDRLRTHGRGRPGRAGRGGDDLRTRYVVSGSVGTDGDGKGAVFRVSVDVPGLPVSRAKVALNAANVHEESS